MTHSAEPVFFNPLQEGYLDDPWPHLAELRTHDPVHHLLTGQWALFRYDDVFTLLRDPTLSVDDDNVDMGQLERAVQFEELSSDERNRSILNIDPPDHTRLRRLVSKAFTPRTIESLRPMVQRMVDAMLDAMEAAGEADVVGRLAFPLPFDVISEMLGMPAADKELIRDWSSAIVKTIDPIVSDEEVVAAVEAQHKMSDHLDRVIAWKADHPGDDLLTVLIEAEDDGDTMSARELRDQVSLLFIAGHETTVNLIGTGIRELLLHPQQLELVRDEGMPTTGVDELLRWVSPVQISRRVATADLDVGGKHIPKGAFVLASLASSNRDPAFWGSDAETLDLSRRNAGQHVSFGSGIHYCLGSSLAKLEAEVAIESFVRRFAAARIVGEPVWNGRINLRGLDELEVRLR